METEFRGQVAVVADGGSGIGRAAAAAFAKEGLSVFVIDVDEPAGAETVSAIERSGGMAVFTRLTSHKQPRWRAHSSAV